MAGTVSDTGHGRWLGRVGAEPAVVLVVLTRVLLLGAAPVTLWLVATRRPLVEQSYFFILWNVQALTQLMELGVGSLLVQFASHESRLLTWNRGGVLEGDAGAIARIHLAVRSGRRWYRGVAWALGAAGATAGLWLIGSQTNDLLGLLLPWFLTIVATAAYLPMIPALCVIEGSGGLMQVQAMRIVQSSISIVCLWVLLVTTNALWGVAGFAVGWWLTARAWLQHRLHDVTGGEAPPDGPIAIHDAAPMNRVAAIQWRTGATWLAWWAAPQCVTPFLLNAQGGEIAGRVGMSFAIAMAPLTIGLAWLQARYPRYGALVAGGDRSGLQRLAVRATAQASFVCGLGAIGAAAAVWLISRMSPALGSRALTPSWILVIGLSNLAWLLVQSLSGYLRAWRQEPLMESSILGAAFVIAGTFAAAIKLPVEGVMVTYASLILGAVVPLTLLQFRQRSDNLVGVDAVAESGWSRQS